MTRPGPAMRRIIPALAWLVLAVGGVVFPGQGPGGFTAQAQTAAVDNVAVPEPEDYRTEAYRAPVPATLAGGTVIDTETAERLHGEGVAFVDVLPRPPRPDLPASTLWRERPRNDIPGSLWLVDTGYGALTPAMEAYLLDGLATATGGDKSRPLVIYCDRDCWMSYNAAKRAIRAGYEAVYWYPDGVQGWAEAGNDLAANRPEPRPDE